MKFSTSVTRKISARIESTKPNKTESRSCHDQEIKAQTHLHSASKSNLTVSKTHHLTPFAIKTILAQESYQISRSTIINKIKETKAKLRTRYLRGGKNGQAREKILSRESFEIPRRHLTNPWVKEDWIRVTSFFFL